MLRAVALWQARRLLFPALAVAPTMLLAGCRADVGPPIPVGAPPIARQELAGADVERGRAAIRRYGCGACHVVPGVVGAQGLVGPPLNRFAWRAVVAGRIPNTAPNLTRWIETPQSVDAATAMPNLGVTPADARDIAAFLYTLK